MKPSLQEIFHFTRSERRGVAVLTLGMLLLFLMPQIYASFQKETAVDYSSFEEEINTWETGLERKKAARKAQYQKNKYKRFPKKDGKTFPSNKKGYQAKTVQITPSAFHPNTASKEELLALGLPEKSVNILLNFRKKGGKFRQKEDLKKIYGFKDEWYKELEPFIKIEKKQYARKKGKEKSTKAGHTSPPTSYDNNSKTFTKKETPKKKTYKPVIVDINAANAEDFQKIYGIGPAFSKRIVKFRDKLGGYVSIEQISEVYGLPDSTFQKIKPSLQLGDNTTLKKININTVTVDELKQHPYIKWRIAKAIVKYRSTHGDFKSVEDVQKCHAVKAELFQKIRPYLEI